MWRRHYAASSALYQHGEQEDRRRRTLFITEETDRARRLQHRSLSVLENFVLAAGIHYSRTSDTAFFSLSVTTCKLMLFEVELIADAHAQSFPSLQTTFVSRLYSCFVSLTSCTQKSRFFIFTLNMMKQ